MIVSLDTGILVRATPRSNGPARRLLGIIAADQSHVLATSHFILTEVGKVLSYPHMHRLLNITPNEIHEHVAYLRSISRVVEPYVGLPVVLTDPKDDPVLYTAVSARADVLCARDRAFYLPNVIEFCQRYGIEVMDEIKLLRRLLS